MCYIGEIHDEGIFKGSISIKVVRISSYHLWKSKNMFGDNTKQVDFANRKIITAGHFGLQNRSIFVASTSKSLKPSL